MKPSLEDPHNLRLNEIPTNWIEISEAHGQGPDARAAQDRLLRRYGPAILRYLIALTHNSETASDLFQVFARKFIEGKLRNADPARGKFRSYLKTTLVRLVSEHRDSLRRNSPLCLEGIPEVADDHSTFIPECDRQFLDIWRNELLRAGFDELQEIERGGGPKYYTALDIKLHDPEASATELAKAYSSASGDTLNEVAYRRLLHLARKEFADRLLKIVQDTLTHPSLDELESELIEVGLHHYCRPAIERRRSAGA